MNKPRLALVAKPPLTKDERGKTRMEKLRHLLMAAAVNYVRTGTEGKPAERLIIASDKSGIPRGLIELELRQ